MELIIPKDYDPRLSIRETQDAIPGGGAFSGEMETYGLKEIRL